MARDLWQGSPCSVKVAGHLQADFAGWNVSCSCMVEFSDAYIELVLSQQAWVTSQRRDISVACEHHDLSW